ncbi:hypothetical protein E4U42_001512 [Claviceps africana]|uniref:Rhodopsin domain-containing protein n=1 Tax=Claviceps africana TaxID=83212 RepID=A0A8K0IZB3_9HYPO|nr:hypothetical protein E4U42_001512 [Claviceps africana]
MTSRACGGQNHRPTYRAVEYLSINLSLGILSSAITVARLVFKRHFSASRRYGADDWVVVATLTVGLPCAVVNHLGLIRHGLGRDAWTMSTDDVSVFAMYFYVLEVLYLVDISLVKMTLLAFYLGIFPSVSTGRWTRRLLWGSVAINAMLAGGCVLVTVFQCRPVAHYWTQFVDDGAAGGGWCIPATPTAWVNGSLNVALDMWMILIPLFEVRHLRLHWKKKTGVVIMFLLGTFVTVVSVLRLAYLSSFDASINITWDYYDVALWSTIEINVGIICTSLPTMRLILVRLSPGMFGSQDTNATATATATHSRHSLPFSDPDARRQTRLSSVATTLRDKDEERRASVYARLKLCI